MSDAATILDKIKTRIANLTTTKQNLIDQVNLHHGAIQTLEDLLKELTAPEIEEVKEKVEEKTQEVVNTVEGEVKEVETKLTTEAKTVVESIESFLTNN